MLRFYEDKVIWNGDKYIKDIKDCCGFAKEVKKEEKMSGSIYGYGEDRYGRYNLEKNVKAKIRFVKFEKALAMQVLEMDERFRADEKNWYYGAKLMCTGIRSENLPGMVTNAIYLWGSNPVDDLKISTIEFETNAERDEYLEDAILALRDWAENWEGFEENSAETAHMLRDDSEDDFVLEV